MELLDFYIDLCKNHGWFEAYCSTGEKYNGKMLFFFNTNYRKLLSFQKGFKVLEKIENIERDQWRHHENHGEEIEKQHTVNMLKSKLFSRNSRIYYRSQKGFAFGKIIDNECFTENELWLITYFTILNGYFANIPNYIFHRVNEVADMMSSRGVSRAEYISLLYDFIIKCDVNNESVFSHDYLIFDSFFKSYEDIDFLKMYIDAPVEERERLKEYIASKPKNRGITKDNGCTVSYKYKSTGSYVKSTIIDNARIQYLTLLCLDKKFATYTEFYNYVISEYSKIYPANKDKVLSFINENASVYELIFKEVFDLVQYSLNYRDDSDIDIENIDLEEISQRIDDTDIKAVAKYNQISSVLKKIAKVNSDYHCELEELFDCQYFTSKESHKNYVEVHHFIPRAVGNDFEDSIEVVENYVPLCPHCHRLVHLGEDVERKPALIYLFNKREQALKSKGLEITKKEIMNYYHVEK